MVSRVVMSKVFPKILSFFAVLELFIFKFVFAMLWCITSVVVNVLSLFTFAIVF